MISNGEKHCHDPGHQSPRVCDQGRCRQRRPGCDDSRVGRRAGGEQGGRREAAHRVRFRAGARLLDRIHAKERTHPEARFRRSATTDGEGRFEFADLPAGRFSLSATKSGYVGLQYGQRRPFEAGTPLSVAESENVERIAP